MPYTIRSDNMRIIVPFNVLVFELLPAKYGGRKPPGGAAFAQSRIADES